MKRSSVYIILFILLYASLPAHAQRNKKRGKKPVTKQKQISRETLSNADTSLSGATIEIIQSYKPEIKNTPKPLLQPNLPPVDTTVPVLSYEVPQQTLSYNYTSFPIRPLALGTDSLHIPFGNYAKLGGGNLSTLLFDAGIGSLRGPDYETNLHVHHLSQKGNIEYQKTSLSGLEADGTLHRNDHAWHAGVSALRNQYQYYGYDHTAYTYTDIDSIRQVFTGVKLGIDVKNELNKFKGFDYHPSFAFSMYGDQFEGVERTVQLALPVSYDIDTTLRLLMGINLSLTQFNNALTEQGNNVFQLTPAVQYKSGSFSGKVGINPTFGKNGNAYLLPDIKANYTLPGTQFRFEAGWQARLRQNTFEELSTRNPYMFNAYTVQQTAVHEVFGGLQSNIGSHITFSGRVSWWQYNNLPMFVNDTLTDGKQFNILYDSKVNALSLQAGVRYQVDNVFSLGLTGTWFNFYNKTYQKVWHEPAVQFKGDLMIKPIEALSVTAYVSVLDQIYALAKGNKAVKLGANVDIGAAAEYMIIPRLSAFLQVNNLLSTKYERWQGYPVYGFNILGGLRLKF